MSAVEVAADDRGNDDAPPPITTTAAPADKPTPPIGGKKKVGPLARRPAPDAEDTGDIRETRNMLDWLRDGIGETQDFKIVLHRSEPEFYMGKRIKGHIDTFTSKIDETQVKAMFGGGRYKMQIMMPTPHGDYRVAGAKSFDIAGDPIVNGIGPGNTQALPAPREESSVVTSVLETMSRQLDKAEDRASRGTGVDADAMSRAIDQATRPLFATIDRLTASLESANASAEKARTAPPDPVRDRMLDKVMSDDTARMESIRIAHNSEVAMLKQSMTDLENRLRDKHDRELGEIRSDHKSERDRSDRQHERELADLKRSYETQISILQSAHSREVSSLTMVASTTTKISDNDTKRMERENSDLRAEVKALREKKDKSIFEQAKEMEEIKDLFGGGDGEEKKGWERAIEAVGNLPAVTRVLGKLAGGEPTGPGAPGAPPPHVPFVGQDGQMYVHDGQGNVALVPRPQKRLKQRPAAPRPIPPAPTPPPADAPPEVKAAHAAQAEAHAKAVQEVQVAEALTTIDPEVVKMAVGYLENAFRGNQEPVTVAASLRSQGLVPQNVVQFIRDQGVDVLLEKVARLEPSSPFATQAGRNWIRKVAKELIG